MERQMGRTAEVIREAVVIVLLGTLAWLAAEAVLAVRDARRIIDEVPDVVDAALAREAELTRGELADQSALWRRLVERGMARGDRDAIGRRKDGPPRRHRPAGRGGGGDGAADD
jgi:hypothetical protein